MKLTDAKTLRINLSNGTIAKEDVNKDLLKLYSRALYSREKSYKAVGEILGVDQRTAKKYVD